MPLQATPESQSNPPTQERETAPLAPALLELAAGTKRIIERQCEIWLLQTKRAIVRLGLALGLLVAAAGLLVVALIFLLITLYRLLTDICHIAPVWASLLFTVFCALAAFCCLIPMIFARRQKGKARSEAAP